MLPDMDGWDIFQEIRRDSQNKGVKVAFMSVIPVSDWQMDSLNKSGVEDYIMKPFDSEDLIRRVASILR
jgi:DNA-binding response OmpR family regulator